MLLLAFNLEFHLCKKYTTLYYHILGYIKRVIVHPSFMNISYADAEHTLSSMEQGEAIFRPSSKVSIVHMMKLLDYLLYT